MTRYIVPSTPLKFDNDGLRLWANEISRLRPIQRIFMDGAQYTHAGGTATLLSFTFPTSYVRGNKNQISIEVRGYIQTSAGAQSASIRLNSTDTIGSVTGPGVIASGRSVIMRSLLVGVPGSMTQYRSHQENLLEGAAGTATTQIVSGSTATIPSDSQTATIEIRATGDASSVIINFVAADLILAPITVS